MQVSAPSPGFRLKVLGVVLIPILLCAIITTSLLVTNARSELAASASHFGSAIADQLATTVTDQVVQKDILGLNVVLGNLLEKGDFAFASVYGADNHLLAQAGKNTGELTMYSRDVVFQNAAAGYVQIGLDQQALMAPANLLLLVAIGINTILVLVIGLFGWAYADLVYLWLAAPRQSTPAAVTTKEPQAESEPAEGIEPAAVEAIDQTTIMVIKIRPVRLLENAESRLMRAFSLYGGEVEVTEGSDLVVTFRSHNQLLDAICCGLLVNKLVHMERATATAKLGVHTLPSTQGPIALSRARKQATYIASISENKLLTSREVHEALGQSNQVTLQAFHSSLAPDGEVYFIDNLAGASEDLIRRQANQLRAN